MPSHTTSWSVVSSEAPADIRLQALSPAIALSVLALTVVALRWYTRLFLMRNVLLEDIFITLALILSMALTGVIGGEVGLDSNSESRSVKVSVVPTMMKLVFAQSILYQTCIHVVKFSIIIHYFRIFSSNTTTLIACHILLFLVIGAATWGILGVVFMCLPVRKYWDVATLGTCMDPHDHFLSSASMGIVLDFAIWILPMPVIGRMQLPSKQKAGLMVVFGLGGFVCATSVLRLVLVWTAAEAGNVTKSGTAAVIWSTVEINVAIVCASLLAMKPLFVRLFPKFMVATPTSYRETRQLRANSMGWPGLLGLGLSCGGTEGENSLATPVGTSVGSRDQGIWAGRST